MSFGKNSPHRNSSKRVKKLPYDSVQRIVRVCPASYPNRTPGEKSCKECNDPKGKKSSYRENSFLSLFGTRPLKRILNTIISCYTFKRHAMVEERQPCMKAKGTSNMTHTWLKLFRKIIVYEDNNLKKQNKFGLEGIVEEDEMLVNDYSHKC